MNQDIKIGLARVDPRQFFETKIIEVIYEWDSFKKHVDSYSFYTMLILLRYNTAFVAEIRSIRKKLGIPANGYPFEEYDQHPSQLEELRKETERIYQEYNISWWLRINLLNIPSIILYNLVFPIQTENVIHYEDFGEEACDLETEEHFLTGVNIKILQPVKMGAVIKYIKNNWDKISKQAEQIPKHSSIYTRNLDLDLKIIELREEKGMTFPEIADKISKYISVSPEIELDQKSDDYFRRRYDRAIAKINSLFSRK
jgi:hypothetical protein